MIIKDLTPKNRWTKARLADALGIQSRSVQGYESGEYAPEPEKLVQIAEILRFPLEFFSGDDLPVIADHTASFRSMSKMSAALKSSALGAGAIAFTLNSWIEGRFNLPHAELPDLSDLSPETAAATLRRMWGLGEAPITNMIHLLESRGIRVYSLAIEAKEVDAFSVWHEGRPFVFLNTAKSAEHSRFDVGHELGHLVRDSHSMLHGKLHSPEMEKEANAFSSAFLMPRDSVVANRPLMPTVSHLIELKHTWGVSLAALAYRLNHLSLITEWTYRSMCIDIAKLGYRTNEPQSLKHETSQMLGKVFDVLRAEGLSRSDIAAELLILVEDLNDLTFGLILSSVTTATTKCPVSSIQQVKPSLRLV